MHALRVGYVLKRFPRLSETFILHELLELERQNVSIDVFALHRPDEAIVHPEVAALAAQVHYPPPRARSEGSAVPTSANEDSKLAWHAAWIARTIARRRVDHLHAHFATSATVVAQLASRATGVPYSFTAHAKDIYHDSVDLTALRIAIRDAQFVVTVSEFNVAHLARVCGRPLTRAVHRIYNGVDLSRLTVADSGGREDAAILAVGRLVEKKGFGELITAMGLLRDRGSDASLTLVGHGEQEAALRAQIAAARLEDRVTMTGPFHQHQVLALMRSKTLMALPCVVAADGNRDGLPTVILEAMATGLPVLSTDVTGIPEVITDGITGRMVPQRDPAALAGAIETLLSAPAARARMAASARRLIEERFDLRRNVGELARLFRASAFKTSHAVERPRALARAGRRA